jgi:Sulfotransferase family
MQMGEHSMPAGERPIFLIGAPRSGTTLLRYVLSSHPRIHIPPESNFIPRLLGKRSSRTLTRAEAVELVETVLTYRSFFKDWRGERPDPAALVTGLSEPTPSAIVDAIFSEYARQYGAGRWGDKSPIYTMHVGVLARAFPRAQFIHIIRDGRDVALSMQETYRGARFFYIDVYYAAMSWKKRVLSALGAGARLGPSRYFQLRYEDLTSNPEMVIRSLCRYLGESYEPAMTHPSREAVRHHHSRGIHAATRRPLTTSRSRRWRTEMPVEDQRLVHAVAGDLLAELGYDVPTRRWMSPAEYVRLAALWMKFTAIQAGRQALQEAGVFHPTSVLESFRIGRRR